LDESRILNVVVDKEKDEKFFQMGNFSSNKDNNNHEKSLKLILLNHGSKALLAKQCNHILRASGSVLLQHSLGMLLTP
jgi:hypothetical protein